MSSISSSKKFDYLESFCRYRNVSFFGYDHFAHGSSSGSAEEMSIGRFSEDLEAVVHWIKAQQSSDGTYELDKLILVGSSMGLWLSLLLQCKLPNVVGGIIGVGGAPNFTRRLTNNQLIHSPYASFEGSYYIPPHFVEEAGAHFVQPKSVTCPVICLHGLKDDIVPFSDSIWVAEHAHATGNDCEVVLVANGDHRLSEQSDLLLLGNSLTRMLERMEESYVNTPS
ncbi:Alpha/Beta hydrolase protein [Cladochytrium replicatum]|nr:Alpha/Beta hydrolase protein [Cladochytrium replicatum]